MPTSSLYPARKAVAERLSRELHGKLCDECFNEHEFRNLHHACELIDAYRNDYNLNRPHSALGGLTPTEFAAQIA